MAESINDRIQYIVDQYYDGNVSKYCQDIGVHPGSMGDILGGRRVKPSASTLEKIANGKMVKVNIEWVLTGHGEALKTQLIPQHSQEEIELQKIRMQLLQQRIDDLTRDNKELIEKSAVLRYKLDQKQSG